MATIQTINATDLVSDMPTKLNANFAALNAAKSDIAATYYFSSPPNQYIAYGVLANSWSLGDATQNWMRLDRTLFGVKQSTIVLPPAGAVGFAAAGDASGSPDIAIGRSAAGVLEVSDGTGGANLRDISVRNLRSALTTPASAAATGVAGTIVADANFIYVCTATNAWKRVAIATW